MHLSNILGVETQITIHPPEDAVPPPEPEQVSGLRKKFRHATGSRDSEGYESMTTPRSSRSDLTSEVNFSLTGVKWRLAPVYDSPPPPPSYLMCACIS